MGFIMRDVIKGLIRESIGIKERIERSQLANVERAVWAIVKSLKKGGKVLLFGNGGSAADSQHIAAELVGRFKKERKPLAAIALTTNSSTVSALSNDYGYDVVFSRQVAALGQKGDVAIGISTSGSSKNVIDAIRTARSGGLITISLTGGTGGKLKKESDISIVVDSKDTARIQEAHIMIGHIICELIEQEMFK